MIINLKDATVLRQPQIIHDPRNRLSDLKRLVFVHCSIVDNLHARSSGRGEEIKLEGGR